MGKEIKLDPILAELGSFGKYNIINFLLLLIPIWCAGLFGSVFIFEAPDLPYRCRVSECENLQNQSSWLQYAIPKEKNGPSKCKRYHFIGSSTDKSICTASDFNNTYIEKCNSYIYSNKDSAVKDFDLGCQDWKRTLIGTVHNAGLIVSIPITGIISDKFGRKSTLALASLMNGTFGFLRSFSVNYYMLVVFEFLEAGLGAGAYSTSFIIAVELVAPKGRVFVNTLISICYVLGLITLAGLSWWLQNWRTLLRIIYTPALFVFSYIWILNESVRWLIAKGRYHEALTILEKAAAMNKVSLSEAALSPLRKLENVITTSKDDNHDEATRIGDKKSDFAKLIRSSIIRNQVIVCSFLWTSCTFIYYGLSINSVSLAGNMYTNFIFVSLVEIPAYIFCLFILDVYGRKKPLIISFLLSACLCISLSFIPKDQEWCSLILYLTGKFAITIAYTVIYIFVSEVFPTTLRQSLLGICSSLGRIGSTLAPLTPLLELYYHNLPAIFFGMLSLIASVLVLTLPETVNITLPDTIEDAEILARTRRGHNSRSQHNEIRIGDSGT